jgi:hypothetical protein
MMKRSTVIALTACALLLGGCSDSRMAAKGAGEGAAAGAASGAVWGALWSAVWGGNVVEGAAAGAAVGAGTGAAAGAVAGGAAEARVRDELGRDNYRAVLRLVDCEHAAAREALAPGSASDDRHHRLAALWIDVLIAEDENDKARLPELYERVVAADDEMETVEDVRVEGRLLLRDLREYRRELTGRSRCP